MYKLRALMYNKYGEVKFAVACIIVAQWVQFECLGNWTAETVLHMCNTTNKQHELYSYEAEALRQLFGLKTIDDLYNN